MRKLRVYVDTSVFGGIGDPEFAEFTRRFFERVRRGLFTVLVSAQVYTEIAPAPETVRDVLRGMPEACVERVPLDEDVRALADAYIAAGVLGEGSKADAVHVAAASVVGADLILSWNFRHIVSLDRIRMFNGVNALNGYPPLDIRSPAEVSYGANEDV